MNMSIAEIEKHLKVLRLHGIIATLESRILQANQGTSFTEVFACLVQDELDYRKSRLTETRFKASGLKEQPTLTEFDWAFNPKLPKMEIYELVGEAYAKFYLNPGYMKTMFTKALFDPKFKWYLKISHKWLKQFAKGGWAMLRSQGITFDMARQDEKLLTRKSWGKDTRRRLKRRYKRFKHLVKKAMKNDHTIKSPAIRSVMQKLKL